MDTPIVPQMLRQNARTKISIIIARCFFPIQNNFPVERWEKLGFISFKD